MSSKTTIVALGNLVFITREKTLMQIISFRLNLSSKIFSSNLNKKAMLKCFAAYTAHPWILGIYKNLNFVYHYYVLKHKIQQYKYFRICTPNFAHIYNTCMIKFSILGLFDKTDFTSNSISYCIFWIPILQWDLSSWYCVSPQHNCIWYNKSNRPTD